MVLFSDTWNKYIWFPSGCDELGACDTVWLVLKPVGEPHGVLITIVGGVWNRQIIGEGMALAGGHLIIQRYSNHSIPPTASQGEFERRSSCTSVGNNHRVA